MKLFFLLLILCLVSFSLSATTPYYYGNAYQELRGASDGRLKAALFQITNNKHKLQPRLDYPVSFSYRKARELLFNEIHLEKDESGYFVEGVYCFFKLYPADGKKPSPQSIPNSAVMNTEHAWPQSKFNGRISSNKQKSDLHHLFPTYSRINSERGNLPFADVAPAERELSCTHSTRGKPLSGGRGLHFEPPARIKGNIARALFYFSMRYQISIDPVQEYYLRIWHKDDPVDDYEKKRHEKIFSFQKNRNPFIDFPDLVDEVDDF